MLEIRVVTWTELHGNITLDFSETFIHFSVYLLYVYPTLAKKRKTGKISTRQGYSADPFTPFSPPDKHHTSPVYDHIPTNACYDCSKEEYPFFPSHKSAVCSRHVFARRSLESRGCFNPGELVDRSPWSRHDSAITETSGRSEPFGYARA